MPKKFHWFVFLLFLTTGLARPASAQTSELDIRLSRIIGYSNGAGDIQGDFRIKATGPETLERVVFYIDGEVLGEVSQSPFELRFNTDSYPQGIHKFIASGTTRDGQELTSREIQANFVSAEEGWKTAGRIALPLLAIIVVAMLASALGPVLLNRGKNLELPLGQPRRYGITGGAICPRCGRPFARHIFSLNIAPMIKLDRCPYCGKWGLMRARSLAELRAAEAAELEQATTQDVDLGLSEEEKLRKELDNSRYQDL